MIFSKRHTLLLKLNIIFISSIPTDTTNHALVGCGFAGHCFSYDESPIESLDGTLMGYTVKLPYAGIATGPAQQSSESSGLSVPNHVMHGLHEHFNTNEEVQNGFNKRHRWLLHMPTVPIQSSGLRNRALRP